MYDSQELAILLPDENYELLKRKVGKLSELVANKSRIIKTQERLINQQKSIIAMLESKL